MSQLLWLDSTTPFPDPKTADPNGLLAASYDLEPDKILEAYQSGIFPWYSDDQPVLWWSPNPRCIIYPKDLHFSKSLKKHIRKKQPTVTFDKAFRQVIQHCARLDSEEGTWITEEMEAAYTQLHHSGHAHSVEVWQDKILVGGLYGIAMGRCFFGESMFSLETNASKVAFIALCQQLHTWGYQLIDCQVDNPHLRSLGAITVERDLFLNQLKEALSFPPLNDKWNFDLKPLK
mgnify:FL=1